MNPEQALSKLADVAPPPPPDWQGFLLLWGMLATLAIAIGLWWILRRRGHRTGPPDGNTARIARGKLQTLREAWQDQRIDDREAAYRLANLLRLGLGLPQLRRDTPVGEPEAWRELLDTLDQLRYRPAGGPAMTPEVFRRARYCLDEITGDA